MWDKYNGNELYWNQWNKFKEDNQTNQLNKLARELADISKNLSMFSAGLETLLESVREIIELEIKKEEE